MSATVKCPVCHSRMVRGCVGYRCPTCGHSCGARPARWTRTHNAVAVGMLAVMSVGCGPAWDAAKQVVGWCLDGVARGFAGSRDAGVPTSSGGEGDAGATDGAP